MPDRDPLDWPPAERDPGGEDSIAGQLASRIDALPPAPGDAIDWANAAAVFEREAAALGARPAAAQLLYEAGRIHEERLGAPTVALEYHRRASTSTRRSSRTSARAAASRWSAARTRSRPRCSRPRRRSRPSEEARSELLLLRGRLLAALGREAESSAALARAVACAPGAFAAAEEAARAAAVETDRAALAEAYVRCARAAADRHLARALPRRRRGVARGGARPRRPRRRPRARRVHPPPGRSAPPRLRPPPRGAARAHATRSRAS